MLGRSERLLSALVIGGLLLAAAPVGGPVWAKASKTAAPGLWIAADRIVGFVPFTIYVYGKVIGAEPAQIELCRSEVAWIAESASTRIVEGGSASPRGANGGVSQLPGCASGKALRTPDGYDFSQDMSFDKPGVYYVRLIMVDAEGNRRVSNSVRVSAF